MLRSVTVPSSQLVNSTGANVLIVEDYIPEYRSNFWEQLHETLHRQSIALRIAVDPATFSGRRDGVGNLDFVETVPNRSVRFRGRRLVLRNVGDLVRGSDLVVFDQALKNLELYPLLLRQRLGGTRVALWGHGATLVKPTTRLERALSRQITGEAHWFFAYTAGSAARATLGGFPKDRITVVQNTIDTDVLAAQRRGVSEEDVSELRTRLKLPPRNVCLFIGGLDAPKRIPFLLDACRLVAQRIPDFTLVIAGDGPDRPLVERALPSSPWLRFVGRATGVRKAELGAAADLLLMPGRVGLVAVDSFVLGTPIATTRWPFHGPEVDYLEDGLNARISGNTPDEFAGAVSQTLLARDELERLSAACLAEAPQYCLGRMVSNFAGGVISALNAPRG